MSLRYWCSNQRNTQPAINKDCHSNIGLKHFLPCTCHFPLCELPHHTSELQVSTHSLISYQRMVRQGGLISRSTRQTCHIYSYLLFCSCGTRFVWMFLCYLKDPLGKTTQPAAEADFLTAGNKTGKARDPVQKGRMRHHMKSILCLSSGQTPHSGYRHPTEPWVYIPAYFALRSKEEWKHSYWTGSLALSRGCGTGNLSNFFSFS